MADRHLSFTATIVGGIAHLTIWETTWEAGVQQPGQFLVQTSRELPQDGTVEDLRRDVAVALAELL